MSTVSTLYRLPAVFNSQLITIERVADVDLRAQRSQGSAPVTAADISRDARRVAITTNKHLYVYRFNGRELLHRLHLSRLPKGDGIEALAFDGPRLLAGRENGYLVPLLLPSVARPKK